MTTFTTPITRKTQPEARTRVKWSEVLLFSLMAYGFTWAWQAVKLVPHLGSLLTANRTPADATAIFGSQLYPLVGMFGPMLAAIIMRLFVSREGLRGSLGLRQPWRYYLLAVFVPIGFMIVISIISALTGVARFALPQEAMPVTIVLVFALLLIMESGVAFGEEYGWRGYLLPRLMPFGEIGASLILGTIWALWHLPVLLGGLLYPGSNPWLLLLMFWFTVTMSTFAYTWLAVASHHSAILASIFHGSSNWSGNRLRSFMAFDNLFPIGLLMGAVWFLVVLVVYGVFKRSPQVITKPLRIEQEENR